MGYKVVGTIYIPIEDFLDFVSKYTPSVSLGSSHFNLDDIKNTGEEIRIEFAASDETPPTEWPEPPWWLRQKKSKNE